ncbi:hypothetical protein [Anaeromyxobacter sp. SG66]|uniref:hypothetical protein n=1 Tax=Anaeromyxobacter sp. SG66 TaxID=2925410 RepID=UPI001F568B8B|nr:hypothetical protein [Anaeromyxobacter sp. SG66]
MPTDPEISQERPSRRDIVDAITHEIVDQEAIAKQGGWTPWALLASGAAAVWLLLDQFKSARPTLSAAALAYLSCWLALRSVAHLKELINIKMPGAEHDPRVLLTRRLLQFSLEVIATIPASVLAVVALALTRSVVPRWASNGGLVLASLELCDVPAFMAVSWSNVPAPMGGKPALRRFITAAMFTSVAIRLVLAGGVLVAVSRAAAAPQGMTVEAARVGLLCAAFCFLLERFAATLGSRGTTDELVALRRSVLLRDLDVPDAIRAFEQLLLGVRLADYFGEQVQSLVARAQSVSALTIRLVDACDQGCGSTPAMSKPGELQVQAGRALEEAKEVQSRMNRLASRAELLKAVGDIPESTLSTLRTLALDLGEARKRLESIWPS